MAPNDALEGKKVSVSGPYTYTVADQTILIAKARTVMICDPGQTKARWYRIDTGPDGQAVWRDCKVFVNDAEEVVFY